MTLGMNVILNEMKNLACCAPTHIQLLCNQRPITHDRASAVVAGDGGDKSTSEYMSVLKLLSNKWLSSLDLRKGDLEPLSKGAAMP
jgi:hypothetical protein